MGFNIKHGYIENPVAYFLDDPKPAADDPSATITFQPDVYTFAEMLAVVLGYDAHDVHIVDIGCGWGDKLSEMNFREPDFFYTGIDYGANIEHCKKTYAPGWCDWIEADLEKDRLFDLTKRTSATVMICSDVIEHLADPTTMIDWIVASRPHFLVLSTPERDIQHGYTHLGPSPNLCHVREWNAEELHGYLESCGLEILHHGLTRGNNRDWAMATQLVVCQAR